MSTELPIPTGGDASGSDPVRGVLIVTTILALVLVLGAGYASIQAAAVGTAERLETAPKLVRGAPLRAEPGAGATEDDALGGATPGGVVNHGRVEDAGPEAGMPPLPEDTTPIDYSTIALPDYEMGTSDDGVARPNEEIFPPEILALEGKRIALLCFMMPEQFDKENRKLLSFIVSPFPPGCHFGTVPRADEWISADANAIGGAEFLAYRVVRVIGTLELGEEYDQYGYLMSLYRIRVERVDHGA